MHFGYHCIGSTLSSYVIIISRPEPTYMYVPHMQANNKHICQHMAKVYSYYKVNTVTYNIKLYARSLSKQIDRISKVHTLCL